MKTIRVVAAVIKAVNEAGVPMIFATQRGYGEFKGGWEFPGGKIEDGETPPVLVSSPGHTSSNHKSVASREAKCV